MFSVHYTTKLGSVKHIFHSQLEAKMTLKDSHGTFTGFAKMSLIRNYRVKD